MINRILIRLKVLQIVYSYYQNGKGDLNVAEKELLFSLQKSYDLYFYYLLLITEITDLQKRLIDARKNKLLPSEEELNPDTRLINNRFAAQLAENETLRKQVDERKLSWADDEEFIRALLDKILASDIYQDYLKKENDSYATDKEFWRQVFKKFICNDETVDEHLEDKNIYWNDTDIVSSFALKTIKKFSEKNGSAQPLMPMFKDLDDKTFAINLFRQTILKGPEWRERVEKYLQNWEMERVAQMDMVILQTAMAEIFSFPTIPTNVTLNEYINAAKYFSTPKSGTFINGILNAIITELKKEGGLLKD